MGGNGYFTRWFLYENMPFQCYIRQKYTQNNKNIPNVKASLIYMAKGFVSRKRK